MTGTADVIQLATFRKVGTTSPESWGKPRRPVSAVPETETGKNFRLRQQRQDNWRRADAVREYWRATRDMDDAIWRVQQHELPEGNLHPQHIPGACWPIIAKWRAAIVAQLLTPAPTALEIAWKRSTFKHGDHEYTDVKPERIERAIADDVEFLRTHPTRQSAEDRFEKRREWKAAFRARVTLYAEQNGIPKSELAWLGRLKHQDLVAFAEHHRLRYDWLLEGKGRIFKS